MEQQNQQTNGMFLLRSITIAFSFTLVQPIAAQLQVSPKRIPGTAWLQIWHFLTSLHPVHRSQSDKI